MWKLRRKFPSISRPSVRDGQKLSIRKFGGGWGGGGGGGEQMKLMYVCVMAIFLLIM